MLIIYLLFTLDMLNLSLFMTIFGRHVLFLGGSHLFLGLIGSSSAFISLIWKPVAGSLSDSKGTRKILTWCLTLCLLGNILTSWFKSLYIIFFARILCAFGSPIQMLLKTTVTGTINGNDKISEAFNKIGVLLSLCFIGGALVSGFVSEYQHGFFYIYFIISANTLISIVLATFLPIPKEVNSKETKLNIFERIKSELKMTTNNLKQINWNVYWDIFAIKGALDLSYGIMQANMGIILLTIFNAEGRLMGYIITLIGIASILSNIIVMKLNKSVYINDNGYTKILHGTILLILSYLGLGLSPLLNIFIGFIVTMSVSRTFLDSSLNELLTSKINSHDKGKMISIFDSIFSLAELVSPILSSLIASIYGVQFMVLLCSVPALVGTVIAYCKKNHYFTSIVTHNKRDN